MSWVFTTPIDVSEVDPDAPGGQLTHAIIEPFNHSAAQQRIGGLVTYGWVAGSSFVPTRVIVSREFSLTGSDYLAARAAVSNGTDTWYDGVAQYLYESLAARPSGHIEGWLPPGHHA